MVKVLVVVTMVVAVCESEGLARSIDAFVRLTPFRIASLRRCNATLGSLPVTSRHLINCLAQVLLGPQTFSSIASRLAELGVRLMLTETEAAAAAGGSTGFMQQSTEAAAAAAGGHESVVAAATATGGGDLASHRSRQLMLSPSERFDQYHELSRSMNGMHQQVLSDETGERAVAVTVVVPSCHAVQLWPLCMHMCRHGLQCPPPVQSAFGLILGSIAQPCAPMSAPSWLMIFISETLECFRKPCHTCRPLSA